MYTFRTAVIAVVAAASTFAPAVSAQKANLPPSASMPQPS